MLMSNFQISFCRVRNIIQKNGVKKTLRMVESLYQNSMIGLLFFSMKYCIL